MLLKVPYEAALQPLGIIYKMCGDNYVTHIMIRSS